MCHLWKSNDNNTVHSRVSTQAFIQCHAIPRPHRLQSPLSVQSTAVLMFVTSLNQSLPLHRCLRSGRHMILIFCSAKLTIHSYTRAINQLLRLVYESTWLSASDPLQEINSNPCNKYESSTSTSMFARIIVVNFDVCVCVHMCSYVSNGVKDTVLF